MSQNRTLFRAIEILKYIANFNRAVTLEEICKEFELPKTSAYVIMSTLVSNSFVQLHNSNKTSYTIGLCAYQVGMSYQRNLSYDRVMTEPLTSLANKLNKTTFFAVPNEMEIVYILKVEPLNPSYTTGRVGGTNPFHSTALGKLMVAYSEEDYIEKILSSCKYEPYTKYTISNKSDMKVEFEKIRAQGYAVDMREFSELGVCVAAPIFNVDGKIEGGISAAGVYNENEDYAASAEIVKSTARYISKLLGYVGY